MRCWSGSECPASDHSRADDNWRLLTRLCRRGITGLSENETALLQKISALKSPSKDRAGEDRMVASLCANAKPLIAPAAWIRRQLSGEKPVHRAKHLGLIRGTHVRVFFQGASRTQAASSEVINKATHPHPRTAGVCLQGRRGSCWNRAERSGIAVAAIPLQLGPATSDARGGAVDLRGGGVLADGTSLRQFTMHSRAEFHALCHTSLNLKSGC